MSYPISKHEENEKLKRETRLIKDELEQSLRDNAELKAMVNEFVSVLKNIAYEGPDANAQTLMGWALDVVNQIPFRGPAQSLEDYGMRVAEAVREACSNAVWHGDYDEVKRIIRNVDLVPIVSEVK